jgi:hypothetical protein
VRKNYVDVCWTDISDYDLDAEISELTIDRPQRGDVILQGYLESRGLHVQRQRVRDSVIRINPEERARRRRRTIQRRVYNVAGPHHLWHLDGNHKLHPFHIVVHGAIDGFSRAEMFIRASDNNRSATVMVGFLSARLRTDKGRENVLPGK